MSNSMIAVILAAILLVLGSVLGIRLIFYRSYLERKRRAEFEAASRRMLQ